MQINIKLCSHMMSLLLVVISKNQASTTNYLPVAACSKQDMVMNDLDGLLDRNA